MRTYKDKIIKSYTKTELHEIMCDLCKKVAKKGLWDSSIYKVAETEITVTITQKEGEQYPEGGYGTKYIVDICPTCFRDKFISWMQSQGANIPELDWENEF